MASSGAANGTNEGTTSMVTLREVLNKCALSTVEELKDEVCCICKRTFLDASEPEIPLKLPCGYVIGTNRIIKWLSPIPQNAHKHKSCPSCREKVLQSVMSPEERRSVYWRRNVRAWDPRYDIRYDNKYLEGQLKEWALKTDYLWIAFYRDVVCYIEDPSVQDGTDWADRRVPLRNITSCATFKDFTKSLLHGSLKWGNTQSSMAETLNPEVYRTLRRHLGSLPSPGGKN